MSVRERVQIADPTAAGDYQVVYERNHQSLWRYVHRLLGDPDATDDVVQETFVRLLSRPDLDGEPARLWLFTVATNLVRDRGRMSSRRARLLSTAAIEPDPVAPPDRDVERAEKVRAVRRALEQIPERDRQLLMMREEGFRYHEIAQVVGVAPGSVGTLIARAIKRFMEVYEPVQE